MSLSFIRVLIIAEDPWMRAQLSAALQEDSGAAVVGNIDPSREPAGSLPEADIALVDMAGDGLEMGERHDILDALGIPAVVLVPDSSSGRRALAAGARGVLARDVDGDALIAALKAATHGLAVTDPSLARPASTVSDRPATAGSSIPEDFTPREREVLQLLSEGLPNREIARRLGVSGHTVKFHVNTIFDKLDVHTRTEAVTRAARLGLITL